MSGPVPPPAAFGAFELRAMAALLAQGRTLCAASLLLTAVALVGLFVSDWRAPLWLAAAAGALQLYYAVRVDFDARLLQALAARAETDADGGVARLDAALAALGLRKPGAVARDWPARWRGARALLRKQAGLVILQSAALLAALGNA
ncbi:hypothetical protein RDV84_02740 [Lysobacter yananisis]|uniref:Uncharacterized protein n=1 Tax=Lysobacter yananisis TaxID=1003114 RepID=A0ABY9PAF7_9GAMM|nr:hypothetical protein [Lysobacter yananisis]WMT03780.1 hypothetical protein RDV84_02740 [Lysobacter yananisis]